MNWLSSVAESWILLVGACLSLAVNFALLAAILHWSSARAQANFEERRLASETNLRRMERRFEEALEDYRHGLDGLRASLAGADGPTRASQPEAPPEGYRGVDKKHHVLSLARQGLDCDGIAKRLNLYRGETELMLSLQAFMTREPPPDDSADPIVH